MKTTSWLLFGGPGDGRVLRVKSRATVTYHHDGQYHVYTGRVHILGGEHYRIGITGEAPSDAAIERAIREKGLEPMT